LNVRHARKHLARIHRSEDCIPTEAGTLKVAATGPRLSHSRRPVVVIVVNATRRVLPAQRALEAANEGAQHRSTCGVDTISSVRHCGFKSIYQNTIKAPDTNDRRRGEELRGVAGAAPHFLQEAGRVQRRHCGYDERLQGRRHVGRRGEP
jgi:hypothetical protein